MSDAVLEETKRFQEALPELLKTIGGKWVVFKDNQVVSVHDDPDSAYADGLNTFGLDGTFVIARVELEKATPISAGTIFGLAC